MDRLTPGLIIIQARMGSTRLPGKVLADIAGWPLMRHVAERGRCAAHAWPVLVATTLNVADDPVAALADQLGLRCFRGSDADVLDRFIHAARWADASHIVRVTADNPFTDPAIIDAAIDAYLSEGLEYLTVEEYPAGLGEVEVASLAALEKAASLTTEQDVYYREHVMTYFQTHASQFRMRVMRPAVKYDPRMRLTVDTPDDLERARRVAEHFLPRRDFGVADTVALLESRPDLLVPTA